MSTRSNAKELQWVFGKAASHPFNAYSKQVFTKLHDCHTAAIGVHTYKCSDPGCNHLHHQYHSCGNRHCPNCGGLKKEQWIENLTADLMPTAYYHVVFTLPTSCILSFWAIGQRSLNCSLMPLHKPCSSLQRIQNTLAANAVLLPCCIRGDSS